MLSLLLLVAVASPLSAKVLPIPGEVQQLDSEALDDRSSVGTESETTRARQLRHRLAAVAIVGGELLALLAVLFAYLRLDHATRGFYSGRLQSLAVITALVLLALGYALWNQLMAM